MANLIDWSEVESQVTAAVAQQSCESRSEALGFVVLPAMFGLTAEEVDEALTDGPSDRGIDAIVIDDETRPPVVRIFQFKCVEKFEKATDHFPGSVVDKLLSFVRDLLEKSAGMKDTCNPLLWGKVCEIWDLLAVGPVRFEIYLVGNQAPLVEPEMARLRAGLRPEYFSVLSVDLPALAASITDTRRGRVDGSIRLVDNQYFERSDGNIRGLIATIQATDLVALIRDPGDADRVNRNVFDENIRVYLTRKNKINQRIYETAKSANNAEFWYLNNGITLTCESFSYTPGVRAPVVQMKSLQIVNGGQTSNALFEANREASEDVKRALVLIRIYETKSRETAARVAESTNSQTPISSRDLRANDEIQRKLELALAPKGWLYERKAFQHKEQQKERRIDALAAAQALAAFQCALPEIATKDRGKLFGEFYDWVFNENLTAERLLASTGAFDAILREKKRLESAIRRGLPFREEDLLLIDGAYYVLYALGLICAQQGVDLMKTTEVVKRVPRAMKAVAGVVAEERRTDPAFAHKRFFKSRKAKAAIEEACRRDATGV